MTTEIEPRLLEALRIFEDSVARLRDGGPKPDLKAGMAEIERLAEELPPDADPELRHFLQRRSYEKARLFLEGRLADIQRGGCTRRAG